MRAEEGARFRASLSWQGCADAPDPSSPNGRTPGIDYDLYLVQMDASGGPLAYYGSQSYDDVNEGFDVDILTEGTYQLIMVWPETTSLPCQGVKSLGYFMHCSDGCFDVE